MIGQSPTYLLFFRDTRRAGSPLTPYEWSGESLADCVRQLPQCDAVEEAWRLDSDIPPENVSADAAAAWWRVLADDFDPQSDCVPAFVENHLPDIDRHIENLRHKLAREAADFRAKLSPHLMGRI